MLGEPESHVWGYLECLWEVAYESGNPMIGDAVDVVLAAKYPHADRAGRFVESLLTCGGIDSAGFLDPSNSECNAAIVTVRYSVHDLHSNAPAYVFSRHGRESERQKPKACEWCRNAYHSSETHSRFCSNACRAASYRKRIGHDTQPVTHGVTEQRSITSAYEPPAPAPAPLIRDSARKRPKAFVVPSLDAVARYCAERRNSVDPQSFLDHYESNGWKVGRTAMKDWQAAVRQWEKREGEFAGRDRSEASQYQELPPIPKGRVR